MKLTVQLLLASLFLASSVAVAAVSDEDFDALRGEIDAMSQKVDELAAENAELRQQSQQTAEAFEQAQAQVYEISGAENESWADRIKISGDFRYRYENIDEDGKDERNRSRIRARTAIKADLPNNIEVGFGLATGGEDPVSTNVTLGGGGSSKEIRLDLAYATWRGLDNTNLTGGKFKNPLVRPGGNGLLWDSDWRPEGLMANWDNGSLFGTALGSWLEGDSKKGTEFFWGVQAGWKAELSNTTLLIGASYFDIGVEGEETVFGDADEFFGNSGTCVDPVPPDDPGVCTYDINYEEIEVFAEVGTELAGVPVKLFADYVQNQDADDNDTGWAAGIKAGKAKDSGKWEGGYLYQDLEADAAFGLVTDSDFGGGGTDSRGHRMYLAYGLNKFGKLKATYFINEVNVASGAKDDYNRLMLDLSFKFK